MSLLAALALAATPGAEAPAATPDIADEQPIVVIGQKLKTWRGRLVKVRGTYKCRNERSTGDTAIDAIGCQALLACTVPIAPKLDAIIKAKQPKADRQRRLQAELDAILPCLTETRDELVRDLADRRSAAA